MQNHKTWRKIICFLRRSSLHISSSPSNTVPFEVYAHNWIKENSRFCFSSILISRTGGGKTRFLCGGGSYTNKKVWNDLKLAKEIILLQFIFSLNRIFFFFFFGWEDFFCEEKEKKEKTNFGSQQTTRRIWKKKKMDDSKWK